MFPSGRAFGYITYPPATDGKPTFNEGYLFDGDGELVPARVVQAPWLRRAPGRPARTSRSCSRPSGAPTTIHGETVLSTFMVLGPLAGFALHQAIVRYTWDGEPANGMLERSTPGAA